MLMPKFSLRQALIALGTAAVLLAFLGAAWRGSIFAVGIFSGLIVSIIPILLIAGIYWGAYGIARIFHRSNLILITLLFHFLFVSNNAEAKQQLLQELGRLPVGLIPNGEKGFDIDVETVGDVSNGLGYSTIVVTIGRNPAVPGLDDQNFTVRIGSLYGYQQSTEVVRSVTIPAGKTSATVELYSSLSDFGEIELSVFRGNNADPRNRFFSNSYRPMVQADGSFSGILIDSKATGPTPLKYATWKGNLVRDPSSAAWPVESKDWPFPRSMGPASGNVAVNPTGNGIVQNAFSGFHRPAVVNPQLLSVNWIGLTSMDVVFVRKDELNRLKSERPELCLMLERWTSVGGSLVVFDLEAGSDRDANDAWKSAAEILPALLGDAKTEATGPLKTVWLEPSARLKSLVAPDSAESNQTPYARRMNNNSVYTESPEKEAVEEISWTARWKTSYQPNKSTESLNVDTKTKFLVTPLVKGRIIAVKSDFRNWQANDWLALRNAIYASGESMAQTFSSAQGNPNRILAIPGIGEPPLQVFQVLVGMFVLLAGPGVYWTLKRTEKLQLFFFVVPILSLLTSLLLFGYIVVADGFQSYGRVQSLTFVDHQTRSSSTSANATYYHNRRPKPYLHTYDEVPINAGYLFNQADQAMEIQGSRIAPRTQHRFENVTSQTMEGYIKLVSAEGPDSKPKIQNLMGAKVRWVVFRTERGWLVGEEIEDQQTKEALQLKSEEMPNVLSNQNSILRQLSPEQRINTETDRYGYYYGYDYDNSSKDLLERLRTADLKLLETIVDEGGYLAILEQFPHVDKQLQNVNFKNQLHIVVGRW